MLIKPDGSLVFLDGMLPYFQVLPFAEVLFQDYVFSGIMLIIINGVSNALASVLILRNKRSGYVLGTIFGLTLMLWITIQFVIFPFFIIDLVYFLLGVFQMIFGYVALVSYNQVYFSFSEEDYKEIANDSDTLVVFFSRKKFTKKIAYERANQLKAEVLELQTKERTEGDLGFWWCGRFAMHRWRMETLPLTKDLSKYNKIIVVTPIWVFKMCAPVRDFLYRYQDEIKEKEISVIFNHFNPWLPKGAIQEVKSIVPLKRVESITTCLSHSFSIKEIKNK
ncbi:MAG: hypothetical protein SPG94_03355 [Candidatus Enterosoma sp.]|nr:hypothetical protein [bacterium]MDD7707227.1 hypothetical protein [bacterium]MDY5548315.1 hypothetical protein [Candidatus Enterosoma sp.]